MEIKTPPSENILLNNALSLEHLSIIELCQHLSYPQPNKNNKGWIGQLIEKALGVKVSAQNQAGPDFQHLGIELKTIPLYKNHPLESTYITTLSLGQNFTLNWDDSVVYQKIKKILWIPLHCFHKKGKLQDRIIGKAQLWEPSPEQLIQLKTDWEEFLEMIICGELNQITAHMGTYLQIRPKANNSTATSWTISTQGTKIKTLPRGFYLRSLLTKQIFNNKY